MAVQRNVTAVCFLLWTFFLTSVRGQIVFGFGQIDYTGAEPNGVTVEIIKRMPNVADFYVNVVPLTYSQLIDRGLQVPPEINTSLVDPAEFEEFGKQDFENNLISVFFPPNPSNGEVEVKMNISFINDEINEAQEGFLLLATIDTVRSNPIDHQGANALRNGIALIRIDDDDEVPLTFKRPEYTVSEGDGYIDDLIYITKENGSASEQNLTILLQATEISALEGIDYDVPSLNTPEQTTGSLEIIFEPTDTTVNISIDIFEDTLFEPNEEFRLHLSTPKNPVINQRLGKFPLTIVHIIDNEEIIIGFEQEQYNTTEGAGMVEVCVAILEPDVTSVENTVQALLFVETFDGSATDEDDYTQLVPGNFAGDNIDLFGPNFRACTNVVITNDTTSENTEYFTLSLFTDEDDDNVIGVVLNRNFKFSPSSVNVTITDDDEPSTPTPTPTSTQPPPTTTMTSVSSMTPSPSPLGMGGDPHFSILLPSGQLLCYSVQGEHDFAFNLFSSKLLHINAMFIADSRRKEITWIGELGITVKQKSHKNESAGITKVRFSATDKLVYIGDAVKLNADQIKKVMFDNGKVSIAESEQHVNKGRSEVSVEFPDHGLSFTVRFVRGRHLDMVWNKVERKINHPHGIIGQFFLPGVEIDEPRRLLMLPDMEPVPVMRKPVWHFMERDIPEDQLCWVAMNPGYQGKKLLRGNYHDYLVDDVLSSKFSFKPSK